MATTLTCPNGSFSFGPGYPTALTGMSINVYKHPQLVDMLIAGDFSLIERLALEQKSAGIDILDITLGHPDLDEEKLMPQVVKVASDVSGLPISIDSTNPKVFEALSDLILSSR